MAATTAGTNGASQAADRSLAVQLAGIDKRFGPVHANKSIDLEIPAGSIHGIVGENGAGKSTLMNILYGFYHADQGTIRIDGREARIRTPQDAIAAGIGMVHQHFMLVEPFTVLENVLLGAEGGSTLAAGAARARAELARLEQEYALEQAPSHISDDHDPSRDLETFEVRRHAPGPCRPPEGGMDQVQSVIENIAEL